MPYAQKKLLGTYWDTVIIQVPITSLKKKFIIYSIFPSFITLSPLGLALSQVRKENTVHGKHAGDNG